MMDATGAYEYIQAWTKQTGYPPSRREIAEHLGISTSTVQLLLKTLEEQGLIKVSPLVSRGVVITESVMKERNEHI